MQLKLRASIMFAVISGLLIPVSISTMLTLRQQERGLTEHFTSDHQLMAELLSLGMQSPLWNLNIDAARPFFDSLVEDERITSVVIADKKAGVFLSREFPERRKGTQLKLRRDIYYENRIIGDIAIEMDTSRLDTAIANYHRIFMLTVAAQVILNLILITALLQVRVLAPIKRLMRQAECLARREHNVPFVWKRRDEFGSLGRTLEKTRQALQELFNELEKKNRELKHDIQRRVLAEQELKRHRDQLEELVEQRTAILASRSEELARSNTELEQLAYVASHDLQEPLRMISSYLQLLEKRYKDRIDADATTFIDFAVDGATRMQALINDLLSYSRIGTKAKPFQPIDCTAVMATATNSLRISIEESKAQITCGPLPTVMGDATQLTQLLQNLLANALKFRRDESPQIHVWAEPDGKFWRFSVQDNGIGIAPEYFDRIFVMFQRLHGRAEYSGTGIGLAICKKIVERHGGRIWVASEEGKGTVFNFTIPRLDEMSEEGQK